MKFLILFLIVFTSLNLLSAEIRGLVVGVSDGDTITVLDDMDKGRFRIRLYGIDAPEKKQDFGQKAKQYLSSRLFRKAVVIRYKEIDRYGRIVGKVYLDNEEINVDMLKNGYAWHYKNYDNSEEYSQAEINARKKGIGLWSLKNPVPPWNFRKK
jgi:endonuclease YncB( thermonuclease family)